MSEQKPRLRKVQARNAQSVTATYAVLLDDKVIGHVDKYVQTIMTHPGHRGGSGQRHRTDTCWGYRVPGERESADGCDTRRDAVREVVRMHKAKEEKA